MNVFKAMTTMLLLLAQASMAHSKELPPEEKERYTKLAQDMIMRKDGGLIRKTDGQLGRIVFANAQTRFKSFVIKSDADYIANALRIRIDVIDSKPVSSETASAAVREIGAEGVVFITDNASCDIPMLAAPEKRWTILNVAPLMDESTSADKFELRARKMLGRAFGMVVGVFNGNRSLSILGPVFKPAHLDWISDIYLPSEVLRRIPAYMKDMGVTSYSQTTYRRACEEGWAPQPTNEFQKAIWDKVHAPPSKPIKITYDKDKQKPVVK